MSITFRSVQSDLGTLITAGNTSSSRELMRVAQINVLRVFVSIPQTYAGLIHDGLPANLVVDELPGHLFRTKVEGITHSVEANSRTMLAVMLVKNDQEALLPGMYAKARFDLPHAVNALMLPADGLMLPKEGPRKPRWWTRITRSTSRKSRWGAITARKSKCFRDCPKATWWC